MSDEESLKETDDDKSDQQLQTTDICKVSGAYIHCTVIMKAIIVALMYRQDMYN